MSAKIAEYKFTDYDSWTAAKSRLYDEVGQSCLQCSEHNPNYYISIWDDCRDPKAAAQICKANGGEAV